MSDLTNRRKFRKRIPRKPEIIPARMGDGNGNVAVDNMPNYVYARIGGRVEIVYNDRIPAIDDINIDVGRDVDNPKKFQVLGTRSYNPGGEGGNVQLGYAPAIRYQWMAENGGQDPLWVEGRQIMPLRIGPVSGLSIQLQPGYVWGAAGLIYVPYATSDLTAHLPSAAGKAALVLITINTSGTLVATKGAEFTLASMTTAALMLANLPAVPASTAYVCGAVRMYTGQTAIQEGRANTDIIDLRFSDTPYIGQEWQQIDRCGFVLTSGSQQTTIAFNDGTYVFTLAPTGTTWKYMRAGITHTITGSKTVTLPGSPPAANTYYIYIDATDGTLTASTTVWTLLDTKIPVAVIIWNNANTPKYHLGEERHTCLIDRREHYREHTTVGTRLTGGGALSGYTVAPGSPADTHNTFAIAATTILDEDIYQSLAQLADGNGTDNNYSMLYKAAGSWTWTRSPVPFLYGTNYIKYNSSGTLTEGATAKFYNWYLCYTHLSGDFRYLLVPGEAEFANASAAYAENPFSFSWTGIGVQEFVVAYQLTFSTNASYSTKGKCRLTRAPQSVNNSVVAAVASSANANTVSVNVSSFGGILTSAETNVQLALDKIDDHTHAAALVVKEEDGTPSVSAVSEIKFTNGTVTDNGSGSVSVAITASASLIVEDYDGSPSVVNVTKIRASNGTVTQDPDDSDVVLLSTRGKELLMQDGVTNPPVPIENEAQDDWLYED